MRKKLTALAMLMILALALTGCAGGDKEAAVEQTAPLVAQTAGAQTAEDMVQTIDAATAHQMMSETEEYILLDVRTQEEYDEAHIAGAVLLPDYDVEAKAAEALPDKDAVILIYCRSGRRSANSAAVLAEMGYTNIYDFGGIIDWPYETVSGPN